MFRSLKITKLTHNTPLLKCHVQLTLILYHAVSFNDAYTFYKTSQILTIYFLIFGQRKFFRCSLFLILASVNSFAVAFFSLLASVYSFAVALFSPKFYNNLFTVCGGIICPVAPLLSFLLKFAYFYICDVICP